MADLETGIHVYNPNHNLVVNKTCISTDKKIFDVLNKILDKSYSFSDDTILNKVFDHLSEKCRKDDFVCQFVLPWLSNVISKWEELKKNIKSFALKMVGAASANSTSGLKAMMNLNVLQDIGNIGVISKENDLSITVSFIEMLSKVVKNIDGALWFIQSGLLEYILNISSLNQSIYINRKTKELIINLVLVLQISDNELCWKIIDTILVPLEIKKLTTPLPPRPELLMMALEFVGCDSYSCKSFSGQDCQTILNDISKDTDNRNDKILPTVQLLCSLMDALLEANCSTQKISMIFKNYNLYLWAWEKMNDEKHNSRLIGSLSSLILYIAYSSMPRIQGKNVAEGDIRDTIKCLSLIIQTLTSKRQYLLVNNICVLSQMLTYKFISTPVYLCKDDGVTYNMCTQVLFLHALPIFIYLKLARVTYPDVADKFADKVFKSISISTKRVCYHYRDTIRVCPQCCNFEELLRSSVQTLSGVLKYLSKDQVVLIFQSYMYLLREFVPDEFTLNMEFNVKQSLETFELVKRYPNLLMDLLDGIEMTIKNYNITWSESLETSCVLVLLMSLSCISDITMPLSTKILRLINLAISNFIPPNLALLVENFKNSSLELLGPLLMRKLNDEHWEVRDSTLEVIQTISSLSALKFPAFQKVLLELNFPSTVIEMFESDAESYVRASAIICLQKMVQVKKLWQEALIDKNLLDKMFLCLKEEPEGIVRMEAASLITAICDNYEMCPTVVKQICARFAHVATSDLYWEVKVNALMFWDAIIDQETANQGMIDGVFPAVTFSKNTRKIVMLTPSEIKKRLKLVLNNLEKYGCLQVLWTCLNDMDDLEVARKSASIISKLLTLLQQYGVVEETCGRASFLPDEKVTSINKDDGEAVFKKSDEHLSRCSVGIGGGEIENGILNDFNGESMFSEEVIDAILNSQDIELLSSVYKNANLSKNDVEMEVVLFDNDNKESKKLITADEFITKVTSLNLESIIKVRSDWIMASDELDFLMDDILAISNEKWNQEGDNPSAKDCY